LSPSGKAETDLSSLHYEEQEEFTNKPNIAIACAQSSKISPLVIPLSSPSMSSGLAEL
jgi:hypothetical protein